MNEKELKKFVTDFRRGILDGESSESMCFVVCAPLQGLLSMYGYDTRLTEGKFSQINHCWLTLSDGRIIDPTADQFKMPGGKQMPEVYIGALPGWYKTRINF